jgi:hypothetical protein
MLPRASLISRANVFAVSRWFPGITWAYTVSVTIGEAWPSRWLTTCTGSRAKLVGSGLLKFRSYAAAAAQARA